MRFRFIFTLLLVTSFFISKSQENLNKSINKYISVGLSIANTGDTSFASSSYPSIELGISKKNLSLGLVLGRSNFVDFKSSGLSNYFYEVKSALNIPIEGNTGVYGLVGIGNYLSTTRFFIEYGLGAQYTFNKSSLFVQVSNWDGTIYLTPGWCYTF